MARFTVNDYIQSEFVPRFFTFNRSVKATSYPKPKWASRSKGFKLKNAIVLLLILTAAAQAADWPQWRGPQRDGISGETALLQRWSADGPAVEWRTPLGNGFSGIAIANGRVYTMFARGEDEFAVCLDAASGAELWRHRTGPYYKETQGGDGPRSTPTIDGETVYVLGATGKLFALAAASGAPIWEKDLVAEFDSEVPRWGFSTSPLVEGDLLLVEAGGRDGNFVVDMVIDRTAAVTAVALDKATGATAWTALDEKMSYSSPIAFTAAGARQLAYFTAYSLTGLAPEDGRVYWRYPYKTRYDVSASTPIFIPPDRLFISSGDSNGGVALQIKGHGDSLAIEHLWQNKKMKNHFGTSVLYQGHLYGFDQAILKCLDADSGVEKWKARGYGKGTLIAADGQLIVLGEQGQLGLVEATPTAFREKSKAQVLHGRCWTMPSLADGRLYLRDESEIVCLDLRESVQ